jgi:hypothetical protein
VVVEGAKGVRNVELVVQCVNVLCWEKNCQ